MTSETETVAVYDPRLQDDIPAWVIENIQAVSAYMKTRGHDDWQIAGIYSAAAHAREAKDAARYRWYRATTVKPILFGDDGWSEADTDAAIDAAMPRVEGQ